MHERASLGSTVRNRRKELGMSQEDLALRICNQGHPIRQTEVSRIELDKVTLPNRHRMEAIAAALELSLGTLLSMSGWSEADVFFSLIGPNGIEIPVDLGDYLDNYSAV